MWSSFPQSAQDQAEGLGIAAGHPWRIVPSTPTPEIHSSCGRAVAAFQRLPGMSAAYRGGFYSERETCSPDGFPGYAQWFGLILPAVKRPTAWSPLGGTSIHMPAAIWHEVGGWDEFNVTEDADLGVRLARSGYRTVILDSETLEGLRRRRDRWIRQRSRWYKGYLQTMVVHLRHP